jgi:hypothetical protein
MRFYTAIAALTLGVSILGMSDAARADDTPQTHLFARASLGAVAMHGSNGQDRDQAGVGLTTQLPPSGCTARSSTTTRRTRISRRATTTQTRSA